MIETYYTAEELTSMAKALFQKERSIRRLDGWFLAKEQYLQTMAAMPDTPHVIRTAHALQRIIETLPLSIDENNIFAGTQRDAFARSYALINPNFKVATFNGYCDPTDVFQDIEPNESFPPERIARVKETFSQTPYVTDLQKVYDSARTDTQEAAYFIEQVTGHLIPDFRYALKHGIHAIKEQITLHLHTTTDSDKKDQYTAMLLSLDSVLLLAKRYAALAREAACNAKPHRKKQLDLMASTLKKVPEQGADNLYEALQSFLLLWQVMCLEQAPNPFAFSVGNADRIFEPYREREGLSREMTAGLFQHFLVFFNVGDRSWAISQNILIGGRDLEGNDLTNPSSYALLDAYYSMNMPQPILSVKLHKNTPTQLYQELGRFLFTPGCLTPSFFNDDVVFQVLAAGGIDPLDLPDYSVAGCQEPLIMGKDNGNTTNSWLNLGKILELTLNDGKSLLTGKQLAPTWAEMGIPSDPVELLSGIRSFFYQYVDYFIKRMANHANGASRALSGLPVPFLSCFMGGVETGIDTRDCNRSGTKYNGSGCLIHGNALVGDSFYAIDRLLKDRPQDAAALLAALQQNFHGYKELHQYLMSCDKYGNNCNAVDQEVVSLTSRIADMVRSLKNYLGNPFRPDFSTPSTHLIYGSMTGALPCGRKAGEMLNYGVDPLYGDATNGLGLKILSACRLPFLKFTGGYASHLGVDPRHFGSGTLEEKGIAFQNRIIQPLFFHDSSRGPAPFYLYVNVTTPETLRMVLADPKKYAPNGIYIMRIHGTFVNFLDLSPEIQEDIIKRLDM